MADAEPAEVLEPADGAFHRPSASEAAELPSVLRDILRLAVLAVGRDQLDALVVEVLIERIGVVGLVADDARRRIRAEHEVKEPLHQGALVRARAAGSDRDRQAACINQHHDFHAFPALVTPTPSPPPRALLKVASMKHT